MLKLTIKKPEQGQYCCLGVLIVTFEQISQIILVFPLLALKKYTCQLGIC